MDIKLLEDFVCLAVQQSFTAAARERNVTQSALSRRVQSLESWLGTELVNRDNKTFALTPQGRIFVSEAEVILRRLYNAREAARVLGANGDLRSPSPRRIRLHKRCFWTGQSGSNPVWMVSMCA